MSQDAYIEALRQREDAGDILTDRERAELDAFYLALEEQEAIYLAPATEQLRKQRLVLEESVSQLHVLREKKQRVLDQMQGLARQIADIEVQESQLLASAKH